MKKFFVKWILGPIITLFIEKIEETENIPREGPYIIVSNQNSTVDGIGIAYLLLKKRNTFIGAITKFRAIRNTFKSKLIKNLSEFFAELFVDAISAREKRVIDRTVNKLKKGKIILIFPEGKLNPSNKLLKARTGAARIALLSKVKILPMGVRNSEKILPLNSYFPRFQRGTIKIGKPFTLEEYYGKEDDRPSLEKATTFIMGKVSELCGKKYPFN